MSHSGTEAIRMRALASAGHSLAMAGESADRDADYAKIVRYVSALLKDAKVDSVDKLRGKPVEATFEGGILVSWRILTEVL